MLDDRIRAVLRRLEDEDARERDAGVPAAERSRQVAPTTGAFLYALCAPQADCEALEIGGSRGYSTIWLAAAVRILGGRVLSLESDSRKIDAWRRNVADAGLEQWAQLVEGDARETLPAIADVFDVVFLMPRRTTTSSCSRWRVRSWSPARSSSPTTSSRIPRRSVRTPPLARPTRWLCRSLFRSTAGSN